MDDTQKSGTSDVGSIEIHTSQQKAGEHHLAEGKAGGAAGSSEVFSESQPTGVPVQRSGDDQLRTSQQIRGEHKRLDTSY